MKEVAIQTPDIPLDAFIKYVGAVPTGGQAKRLIQAGAVSVNGRPEARRARRLRPGDTVAIAGKGAFLVTARA